MRLHRHQRAHLRGALPEWCGVAGVPQSRLAPCDPVVSDYVIDELRRVFSRKFPQRMKALDAFIAALSSTVFIVVTPEGKMSDEAQVRDVNDRPILRAARAAGVDVLVTGDKDFLDSTVDNRGFFRLVSSCCSRQRYFK